MSDDTRDPLIKAMDRSYIRDLETESARLRARAALEGERDNLSKAIDLTADSFQRMRQRLIAAEGERDTATRALAVLDRMAWLAAEEDSWFGDEIDIEAQRAAAERHRAALSKTEAKG